MPVTDGARAAARTALGAEPVTMSPDQFAAAVRKELTKWAKVIKESGARIN